MITAEEYRIAARVLREECPHSDLIQTFEKMADQRAQYQLRIEALGTALEDAIDPRAASFTNGVIAHSLLLQRGWTPPEGLL